MIFKDRKDAARQLAGALAGYKNKDDVVVVTIPRGGVELGAPLALALNAPLEIVLVKKIASPWNPEMAIGAVSKDEVILDERFDNPDIHEYILLEVKKLKEALKKKNKKYHQNKKEIALEGKRVIVVDDGVATGKTMLMALQVLRKQKPKELIVALPVAPADTLALLQKNSDNVIALHIPTVFHAVGAFYKQFNQVSDEEVASLLQEADRER